METNYHPGLSAALMVAYKVVMRIESDKSLNSKYITHAVLVNEYTGVNYNTLRRISQGKVGTEVTDRFYLKLFTSIIYDEYQKRIAHADDRASDMLRAMKEILLNELEIAHD